MTAEMIIVCALFAAIPVGIKYYLAFKARTMLDRLEDLEKEVQQLVIKWRGLKREKKVLGRALQQMETHQRRISTQKSMAVDTLARVRQLRQEDEVDLPRVGELLATAEA
jgi:predicted membrane chloride channel (bestrophin family)